VIRQDFNFLAWLAQTAFFPNDLRKELTALGLDAGEIFLIVHSDAVRTANPVQLFQDYGRNSEWFMRWINQHQETYDRLCEQQNHNNGISSC
jgi:hypothetical protein